MKKIFNIGITDSISKQLKVKIYNSNVLAVIIGLFMCLPFMFITFFLFRVVFFLPTICFVLCVLVLVFNRYNMSNLSRVLLCICPFTLSIIFIAILLPPDSPRVLDLYCFPFCFMIVPFILFDVFREKVKVILLNIYSLVVLVFVSDKLNAYFDRDIDISLILNSPLGSGIIALAILVVFVLLAILSFQNFKQEQEFEQLVEEMNLQANDVKKSENELKDKIKQIEKSQEEEKKRNWITEGIGMINTILRSDNEDGNELYDKITSALTKYLGANQCGLFLVERQIDGEDSILKLKSCYAYSRKKFMEKEIQPGQGLVGQTYLEKSSIYLKSVPQDYVSITSGLGENAPREMLIVPLIVNDEVQGVYEFASFGEFDDYQIQFLEQLGENLAAFINVNRINERTKLLLASSQQHTEEMRGQEEEMRQNMEELAATQEEMGRKEDEYLIQIENLENELKALQSN